MKKIFLFTLIAAMAVGAVSAQRGSAPKREPSPLKFAREEHDFGRIREVDGVVSHTFKLVNRGDEPVAIDRVVASCGCTTSDWPRTLIHPGKRAEITVSFEPMGYRGEFSKSVAVVSGGRRYSNFLVITGKVR